MLGRVALAPGNCRNYCGLRDLKPGEQGARAANEPPSREGWHNGEKVLWCSCCERVMRRIPHDVLEEDGAIHQVRPPNLQPDIDAEVEKWTCDTCGYDTYFLRKVRGAGERRPGDRI